MIVFVSWCLHIFVCILVLSHHITETEDTLLDGEKYLNGIEQDEVYQSFIEYGIQESDFCIEGSFSRKDGDSEPVAVFDIEIRSYVKENKQTSKR